MMVFAFGMSRPFSTIVVASRTSNSPLDEAQHRSFELLLAHLSVTDDDPRFRHQPLQKIANREDRLDAVVDEVHLAAASELVPDRPLDHRRVELDDVGLNRQPILGRRLDHRHVADADERHVQRPRNRRRGHRQDVDALAHLLDALLVRDAEALLLVDDEQARDP